MTEIGVSQSGELHMPNHSYSFRDRHSQVDYEEGLAKAPDVRKDELDLIAKLSNGDESAFVTVVDRYHS